MQNRQETGHVDPGLIRYFLSLTPEERILANDEAVQTILELRESFAAVRTHDSIEKSRKSTRDTG